MSDDALRHPLLDALGVAHGFGLRGFEPPAGLRRPTQVHGTRAICAADCAESPGPEADAIVSDDARHAIGVVTADCVPILLAARGGAAVAAVHAGWRGLADGVIGAGVAALERCAKDLRGAVAVIGPHIGPCCYEVDAPVLDAMTQRFGARADAAAQPTRPGHARLDLGALARLALSDAGVDAARTGAIADACTRCDAARFHSYRRDGARSGRMVHFVRARAVRAPAG